MSTMGNPSTLPFPADMTGAVFDLADWAGLSGMQVLVLGHGISGRAMARWCAVHGANVTCVDTRADEAAQATLRQVAPGVDVRVAPLDSVLMNSAAPAWQLVCKSPGLSPQQLQAVSAWCHEHNVPLVGELTLFAQGLRQLYAQAGGRPKVLAITGTNGKTTTTALTAHLLQCAGWSVAMAGNIGPALLDVLLDVKDSWQKTASSFDGIDGDAIENGDLGVETENAQISGEAESAASTLPDAWVLELSSFQLDGVVTVRQSPSAGFEPWAATVLNVTEDHLDWHGDMAAYAAAKHRVYGVQGLRVLNREDALVMQAQPPAPVVPKRSKTTEETAPPPAAVPWTTFGTDLPTRLGDWGLESVNGMTWLVRAVLADETRLPKRRGTAAEEEACAMQRLMPAEALRIRGRHNAANALAALALATAAGAPLAPMLHGLRDYAGEPHRVEPVAVVAEVEYVDDSKGTNVGATLAAIRGLGPERRLVMILGGDGKGQDFSPLAPAVREFVRAVVLMGRDAAVIEAALADTGVPLVHAADLPQAVREAQALAQMGDAVVLSPACASLDMFRNYAHRAEVFRAAVADLALDAGQMDGGWA